MRYHLLNTKNVDVEGETRVKALDKASAAFNNCFAGLSMAALEQFNETEEALMASPYWRNGVKREMQRARKMLDLYFNRLHEAFGKTYSLYIDYANSFYGILEPDVRKMFFSIKRCLDKYRVPDSELKARIMTTLEIIKQCKLFHRSLWQKAVKDTGIPSIGIRFKYADFTKLHSVFENVAHQVCVTHDQRIELGDDYNCVCALSAFMNRVGNIDRMQDASENALNLNESNLDYADVIARDRAEQARIAEEVAKIEAAERQAKEDRERQRLADTLSKKFKVTKR